MTASSKTDPPYHMAARKFFELLSPVAAAASDGCGASARLGRLSLAGRRPVETPNYTAMTSRGTVPHLTPDNLLKYTSFGAGYMALEDFIEKKDPPIHHTPKDDKRAPLHSFTAFPSDATTILAPRRCPPVAAPVGNNAKSISIFTSTGFYNLAVRDYAAAVKGLRPDIAVALASLPQKTTSTQSTKVVRMLERTEEWLGEFLDLLEGGDGAGTSEGSAQTAVFAPVLPVDHGLQWEYLRTLAEDDFSGRIAGLAVYDVNLLPDLDTYEAFRDLARLSLQPPATPQDVLRQISLGADMCAVPFVNAVSDAGVALTFTFPPPDTTTSTTSTSTSPLPLGQDMWTSDEHATSLNPLRQGCQCYACTHHHRAYLCHLLAAKEMLGWSLLQIHNHRVMSDFFGGVREVLARDGAEGFEKARERFMAVYEAKMPQGTGERPRARGYHFKSEHNRPKLNKQSWSQLDGDAVPLTNGEHVAVNGISIDGEKE